MTRLLKNNTTGSKRAGDSDFSWVVPQLTERLAPWVPLAAEWIKLHHRGFDLRLHALALFFDRYLFRKQLLMTPSEYFDVNSVVPDFWEEICQKLVNGVPLNNYVYEFLEWALKKYFADVDASGTPRVRIEFRNPLSFRRSKDSLGTRSETVRNALPFKYIADLRQILAPGKTFSDWKWAHDTSRSDWFAVDPQLVDENDPDCVWRTRSSEGQKITEIWCPARATALLTKLMLPLRTFQVRMLDSGEADYWRYASSGWEVNEGRLVQGTERKPWQNGVFRRVFDIENRQMRTSIYVNSNKTADAYSDKVGYVIPWQYEEILFWWEKLRNWQEKYNPISEPTSWTTLELKHTGNAMPETRLMAAPKTCFLFRVGCAGSKDCDKPVTDSQLDAYWAYLLRELQNRCAERGESLASGASIVFVEARKNTHPAVLYPLHSLRVSLLTCMALDGEVPLPILSKLVAGHTRLVMTLYYIKVGSAKISRLLDEAEKKLHISADAKLQKFLEEANYDNLLAQVIANNADGFQQSIAADPANRMGTSWVSRGYGICLASANLAFNEGSTIAGCHNGGERVVNTPTSPKHAAVSGGPGNCVRCRWFVTSPEYLGALRAHFNNISYRLSEDAKSARDIEQELDVLRAQRDSAERLGDELPDIVELLEKERLWENKIAKVDQLGNDLIATMRLIARSMELLNNNSAGASNELVAVGDTSDIHMALEETDSELLQLVDICDNALIYPDEDAPKAVLRRSQLLDSALYREGLPPVFMTFSEAEQLRIGNYFINRLKNSSLAGTNEVAGIRRVVGFLESHTRLTDALEVDIPTILNSAKAALPARRTILLKS